MLRARLGRRTRLRPGLRRGAGRLPDLLSGLRLGTRLYGLARLDLRALRDLAPLRLRIPQRLGT